jgi:hypothetical protein
MGLLAMMGIRARRKIVARMAYVPELHILATMGRIARQIAAMEMGHARIAY